jgi:hypothetical protein
MTAPSKKKPPSDMVIIKQFFDMSASEAMAEVKKLTSVDKAQLAGGIRDETGTY